MVPACAAAAPAQPPQPTWGRAWACPCRIPARAWDSRGSGTRWASRRATSPGGMNRRLHALHGRLQLLAWQRARAARALQCAYKRCVEHAAPLQQQRVHPRSLHDARHLGCRAAQSGRSTCRARRRRRGPAEQRWCQLVSRPHQRELGVVGHAAAVAIEALNGAAHLLQLGRQRERPRRPVLQRSHMLPPGSAAAAWRAARAGAQSSSTNRCAQKRCMRSAPAVKSASRRRARSSADGCGLSRATTSASFFRLEWRWRRQVSGIKSAQTPPHRPAAAPGMSPAPVAAASVRRHTTN